MDKINEKFRWFQGNGKTDFTINIISDYPSTEESLELLKQKYPEISNQLTMIYNSFKSFDREDFIFFEGTIEKNGTILPFVNYVCLNSWGSMENKVSKGRNFIIIPNRGTQLYNIGDYNSDTRYVSETYQQILGQKSEEYYDRNILLEKSGARIHRLYFYYKDGSDKYSFQITNGSPNKQNLYLSSYGYFSGGDIELPKKIFYGTTIECETRDSESHQKQGYGMLFDGQSLLRLYVHDKNDDDVKVILYAFDKETEKYKRSTGYKNDSGKIVFSKFADSTLYNREEIEHVVEEKMPKVLYFAKTISPVINNQDYYGIPEEIKAIAGECINYTKRGQIKI